MIYKAESGLVSGRLQAIIKYVMKKKKSFILPPLQVTYKAK